MGCDIHIILEKKHNGKWVGVCDYSGARGKGQEVSIETADDGYKRIEPKYVSWLASNRNYRLFAELAGVRGETNTTMEARGLPKDASDLTRMLADGWGDDGHSQTYMSVDEYMGCVTRSLGDMERAALVADRLEGKEGVLVDRVEHLLGEFFEYEQTDFSDFRLVMWFDN